MSQRTMKNAELLMSFAEIQKIKNLEMQMDNQD